MIRLFKVFIPVGTLTLLVSEAVLVTSAFIFATYLALEVDPTVFLLYDGGLTRNATRAANLGRELAEEDTRRVRMETIVAAARAYYDAVLAGESLKTADQAVRSAEADLRRAETVRAAGTS